MKPILDVTGLRVVRGSTTILDNIAWQVRRGEHWVILGANGSGKTSLLKTLTGFLTPTAGEISVLGQDYGNSDWRALQLHIGVVTSAFAAAIPLAEVALDTVMSGKFAQLDLWKTTSRTDRAEAARLLQLVGASKLAKREWVHFSQGERQRVLIARALMARPKLLILDEPCAGLDPVAREKFLTFINRLARRRRGPSLVLVTHHVEEITPIFTHALLLRGGRVVAAGPRAKLLTSAHLSAALGAPLKLVRDGGRAPTGGRYRLVFARSRRS
ncbi:MAG: ABC transporter ATP-binding protein [Opitutaceae bacterium]